MRSPFLRKVRSLPVFLFLLALCSTPLWAVSTSLVISQVYTAGGNSGATYNADYVEIFNLSSTNISLNGYALQYFAAGGTGGGQVIALPAGTTLIPGQRYLVAAIPGGVGANLPVNADYSTGSLAMGAAAGRIYLTSSTTALSGSNGCPSANVVDYVGYGTTSICFEGSRGPTPTATLAIARRNACTDTDDNGADFATLSPAPRATASVPTVCGTSSLLTSAAVNPSTVTAGSATLLTANGSIGLTATVDLSAFNGYSKTQPLYDDGTNGDIKAGDGTYSYSFTTPASSTASTYTLTFTGTSSSLASGTATAMLTVQLPVATTPIHTLQGNSPGTSPYNGQTVNTSGIVIDVLYNGFHLQARDSAADSDPHTSEGIFVFAGTNKVPANITVGTEVEVTGKVALYPTASSTLIGGAEIDSPTSYTVLSTGNSLPAAFTLTTADPSPSGGIAQLPYLQSMRVAVPSLTVTQPTDGVLTESAETYVSNGQFWGEVTGLPRPVREPGLDVRDPLTASQPVAIPRFDSNPESFDVDSSAALGGVSAPLNLVTGAVVTGIIGTMDLSTAVGPRLIIDALMRPAVANNSLAYVPVPDANAGEITIGDQNMERFYDTTDDPSTSDVVLTPAAYQLRLAKGSLGIRNVLKSPDIVALEEMESLTALTDLSNKISADAIAANQPDPHYQPYLMPGNDIGGINVAFLVNPARINVLSVEQFGKVTTFTNSTGAQAILNDRPPLVLHAGVKRAGGSDYPITVIVNHLRSLNGVTDPSTTGQTVRLKREGQAEYLATLIQGYQAAGERVIAVGDLNTFDVNDGLVDVFGVLRGGPALSGMDVLQGTYGLVNPILVDAAPTDVANGAYSYVFSGYAQSIDHFVVTQNLAGQIRTAPAHWNADFPVIFRNDATRPEASSDHDGIVGYLSVPAVVTGPPQLTSTGTLSKLGDGSYQLTLTVANSGAGAAPGAQLSAAALGSAGAYTALPLSLGDIAPGSSATAVLGFPASAGVSGARIIERVTGVYDGGTFGGSSRTVLP